MAENPRGGGLPLHVNPDLETSQKRNEARIRRLKLKLREIGDRRRRGENGQAVAEERVASMMAELQRRGGMPSTHELADQVASELRAKGLSEAPDEAVRSVIDSVVRRELLGAEEEGK